VRRDYSPASSVVATVPAPTPEPVPEPEPVAVAAGGFADDVERLLHRLWADVLVAEPELIGPDTNFFDLGGDSLKGFWLVRQISEELDVRIPMNQVAELLTIRDLAGYIRGAAPPPAPTPAPAPEHGALPVIVSPEHTDDGAPPVDEDRYEPFPLLPIQRAYWVGQSLDLGGVAARHYLEYQTDGVDLPRLEAAWNRLVRRHEMLRAVVDPDGRQRILPSVPDYRIEVTDLSTADQSELDRLMDDLRAVMSDPPRTSAQWPLFDVRATRLPDGSSRVHLSMNMMLCDGRSFAILSEEWQRLHGEPGAALAPLDLSFRDVVLTFQASDEDRARADEYWKPRLSELPPPPQLPWAREPAELGRPTFHRRSARIDRDRWQALRNAAGKAGIGPSALLLAAYAEVLGTWSASPRFCVNVTTFTLRTVHPAGSSIVGDFTSNVPVEVDALAAPTLRERARRVQRQLWSDVEHVGRSGVELVAEANVLRGDDAFRLGVPYVFTSLLTNDDASGARPPVPFGWLGTRVHSVAQTPQVLVDLQVMEDSGDLVLDFDTIEEMFPDGLPGAVFDTLAHLVGTLADSPSTWDISPLSLTPPAQLTARAEANRTDAPVPADGLHEPFVRRARTEPDRIAVRSSDRTMTYGELDRAGERVADLLEEHGVRRGDVVAIAMRKGWEQVVAVLGVHKAGAAYVPVDPDLPFERRRHLVDRTDASAVLTRHEPAGEFEPPVLVVDGTGAEPRERPGPGGDDLAYVIFTSGSTGQPKGVRIHHRAALNTVLDINSRFGVGPSDAVLALSSLSFDLSVYDVFGVLAAGATIVLPDADRAQDPAHWASLVVEHHVTIWNSVPALYGIYLDHLSSRRASAPPLRSVLLSGDWIPLNLPERSRRVLPDAELTSLGGATEAAIWSIHFPIGDVDPAWHSIPYGRPLTNQRLHVCNAAGAPCPDWVPGELQIAGVGVAQGYHGDEERTRASFPVDRRTGERRYRTGDLGRYLPDGTIEFLGRHDLQVKVQGHRIELGEIETTLLDLSGITEAAVVVLGARDANRTLAAHVVAPGGELTAHAVRTQLAGRLPGYMVPPTVTFWPNLPLTGNGKVDRARLSAAGADQSAGTESSRDNGFEEATTPVQQILSEIWCAVLGVGQIGIHDRFFEFGGDSVLSIQVASRAARAGLALTPRDLFEHQTIAELATIARIDEVAAEAVDQLHGEVPLTAIQRWFLNLDLTDPARFNQSLLFDPLAGPLDGDRLATALAEVLDRHDALRLRWHADASGWTQRYADRPGVVIERVSVAGLDPRARDESIRRTVAEANAGFDLANGPTLRAVLFDTAAGCEQVLISGHHLVVDGVSWQVLLDDLAAAYEGKELPPARHGFGAYARALAGRTERAEHVSAWDQRLAGDVVPIGGSAGLEGQARTVVRALDPAETTELLTAAGAAYRTKVDELLMTALAGTVNRWVGDGAIRVDIEGHGRDVPGIPDVSGALGWFTTIAPARLDLTGIAPETAPGKALTAVKEYLRSAPGDAELLHDRWPRAGIVFNYLGRLDGLGGGLLRIAGGQDGRSRGAANRRPWPIEVDCRVLGGRLEVAWTYDAGTHDDTTMEQVVDDFVAAVRGLVAHCVDPAAGDYTPSDFPLAGLTGDSLARVLGQFRTANAVAAADPHDRHDHEETAP
jgi:amino acid adenylation domain-containing protein/non-ribosomal peptide synthase protein (TIGR01720 family)